VADFLRGGKAVRYEIFVELNYQQLRLLDRALMDIADIEKLDNLVMKEGSREQISVWREGLMTDIEALYEAVSRLRAKVAQVPMLIQGGHYGNQQLDKA
jgi:hypothetical protein